ASSARVAASTMTYPWRVKARSARRRRPESAEAMHRGTRRSVIGPAIVGGAVPGLGPCYRTVADPWRAQRHARHSGATMPSSAADVEHALWALRGYDTL